jgi:purine-binding chemotaxis protein CheW
MKFQSTVNADAGARNPPFQVLTFSLGAEDFGVDILSVKEIRGWTPVTRLPHVPAHILGVLNLRGSIVPIVDLRVRFALPTAEFTPLTVIIVVAVRTSTTVREFGLVVDGVSDVLDIDAGNLKEPPPLGGRASTEFIRGLAIVAERMLILLDVDALICHDMDLVVATDRSAA